MPDMPLVCSLRRVLWCAGFFLAGAAGAQPGVTQAPAKPVDWRSLNTASILYDAPSNKAKPLYIGPAGMPVEALVVLDTFVKVRDVEGGIVWVEKKNLHENKGLSVLARQALIVRQQAEEQAAEVLSVARGVLLEPLEPPRNGWVRVKHRDGQSGYVKVIDLFGL